ncbi:MAG TPA: TlpA disulfide reductase family protein [Steroidobacteraceae bacterium]|nr:TlpA disulfide reductase family protein [Steroidobacteraceae bacterium]
MRGIPFLLLLVVTCGTPRATAAENGVTEADFRVAMNLPAAVAVSYLDIECKAISFAQFASGMQQAGMTSKSIRSPDGRAATVFLHRRGGHECPSPYGRITEMPPFDFMDLSGKRVTSQALRGKPTLMNFYFSGCIPCILEVGPLNRFAASRKDLTTLAVTFDEPQEARAFVARYGFKWRVVPGARDFLDRMVVNRYPMMALFDANGHLLGMRAGGAKDELEAATVEPSLRRWVDGLLRAAP